eukprot:CAMPEP_0196657076 /NCGR_PEP_ID=MMETSP1086-20130531/21638_1 /TAXON_ID=77921 /ORGANISM="Cyanoptyche  gloeocystis , Strain SAG4.97" /LENGTH=108 /DNA_ID=CAMNT_0041990083 /DNA_START=54 /DNA_END=381 /DNA_ORIENTATION=-
MKLGKIFELRAVALTLTITPTIRPLGASPGSVRAYPGIPGYVAGDPWVRDPQAPTWTCPHLQQNEAGQDLGVVRRGRASGGGAGTAASPPWGRLPQLLRAEGGGGSGQ